MPGFLESIRESKFLQSFFHYILQIHSNCDIFLAKDNWLTQSAIIDRREHDRKMFREAGNKSQRTYKFDPTKQKQPIRKKE